MMVLREQISPDLLHTRTTCWRRGRAIKRAVEFSDLGWWRLHHVPLFIDIIIFLAFVDISIDNHPQVRGITTYLASAIILATWVYLQVDCRLRQARHPGRPRSHCEWYVSTCYFIAEIHKPSRCMLQNRKTKLVTVISWEEIKNTNLGLTLHTFLATQRRLITLLLGFAFAIRCVCSRVLSR